MRQDLSDTRSVVGTVLSERDRSGSGEHDWCFRAQCANFADTFGTALCMKQIVYSGCDLASMVVKVPCSTGASEHSVPNFQHVLQSMVYEANCL